MRNDTLRYFTFLFAMVALLLVAAATVEAAPVTATARLTWTAPIIRADGSALPSTQLGPYRVKWGTVTGVYPNVISVPATSLVYNFSTTLDLPINTVGSVYWVMSATDVDGRESANSAETKKDYALVSDAPPGSPALSVSLASCTAPAGYRCTVLP